MTWNPKIQSIDGATHVHFLRQAYVYAEVYSQDPVTKIAAIIVRPKFGEIQSFGANHFLDGVNPTPEQLLDKKWKYDHIIHAEIAAISKAESMGRDIEGAIMYMPGVPCAPCAKVIIDSGITTLIGHKAMIMKTTERWQKDTNFALGLLTKAGIETFMYDGVLGGAKGIFDGQEWYP